MPNTTIVEYFGEQTEYRCGYCKSDDTNYSHGMWAHTMNPHAYQKLIDRGWRRSGKYVYKPTNRRTCCPAYTIRCNALEINLTKSQKKVLKRFNRHLLGDAIADADDEQAEGKITATCTGGGEVISRINPTKGLKSSFCLDQTQLFTQSFSDLPSVSKSPSTLVALIDAPSVKPEVPKSLTSNSKGFDDNTKRSTCKAKDIRQERKKIKLLQRGMDPAAVKQKTKNFTQPKSLEDFIAVNNDITKKFEIRTVKVESSAFQENFELEYQLYRSYQIHIHNDTESDCSRKQFKRFLCDNPFGSMDEFYGTYHQQYFLDDTLIAVGVVDILPQCLSSVYFFYSKNHMNLSLGTFGALREIAYVRELNRMNPAIRYYYMGYYIHSCAKMRYKGCFSPSYLLCPEVYTWHLFDDLIKSELTSTKYLRLNKTEIEPVEESTKNVRVLFKNHQMSYNVYSSLSGRDDKEEVQEYVGLVGSPCAGSMLLYRADV